MSDLIRSIVAKYILQLSSENIIPNEQIEIKSTTFCGLDITIISQERYCSFGMIFLKDHLITRYNIRIYYADPKMFVKLKDVIKFNLNEYSVV